MEWYRKLQQWQWSHNTFATDMVRVFLGTALFVRGILFLINPGTLAELMQESAPELLGYSVALAHTVGGLMMALGLFTRVAALIQIPVLLGAVLTLHIREGLFTEAQSLELATLVLFLLFVFLVFGSSKNSLDYRFFGRKQATDPPGAALSS